MGDTASSSMNPDTPTTNPAASTAVDLTLDLSPIVPPACILPQDHAMPPVDNQAAVAKTVTLVEVSKAPTLVAVSKAPTVAETPKTPAFAEVPKASSAAEVSIAIATVPVPKSPPLPGRPDYEPPRAKWKAAHKPRPPSKPAQPKAVIIQPPVKAAPKEAARKRVAGSIQPPLMTPPKGKPTVKAPPKEKPAYVHRGPIPAYVPSSGVWTGNIVNVDSNPAGNVVKVDGNSAPKSPPIPPRRDKVAAALNQSVSDAAPSQPTVSSKPEKSPMTPDPYLADGHLPVPQTPPEVLNEQRSRQQEFRTRTRRQEMLRMEATFRKKSLPKPATPPVPEPSEPPVPEPPMKKRKTRSRKTKAKREEYGPIDAAFWALIKRKHKEKEEAEQAAEWEVEAPYDDVEWEAEEDEEGNEDYGVEEQPEGYGGSSSSQHEWNPPTRPPPPAPSISDRAAALGWHVPSTMHPPPVAPTVVNLVPRASIPSVPVSIVPPVWPKVCWTDVCVELPPWRTVSANLASEEQLPPWHTSLSKQPFPPPPPPPERGSS